MIEAYRPDDRGALAWDVAPVLTRREEAALQWTSGKGPSLLDAELSMCQDYSYGSLSTVL